MSEKISIIMSVYNENEKELKESIESILNQTYKNIEFIIIIDNPSNNIIKNLIFYYKTKDKRIKVILNRQNIGLAFSLNKGIKNSSGKYIARMDADDISLKDRLEIELKYLKQKKLDVISCNCFYINENSIIIGKKSNIPESYLALKKILPFGSSIIHPSVLMKKEAIEKVGGYRQFKTAQDYDLWLRMINKNIKIGSVNKHLIKYRIRQSSISKKNEFEQCLATLYIQRLYKERKKMQRDTYSIENYNLFLKKNKFEESISKEKFAISCLYFNFFIKSMRQKKYIKSFIFLFNSLFWNKSKRKIILNLLIYKAKILINEEKKRY